MPLPLVSIVIPVYNEIATIERVLDRLASYATFPHEIIVVDDHSGDGTAKYLRSVLGTKIDKAVFLEANRGKGFALRKGFGQAIGEIILVQDADLEYHPRDYATILDPLFNDDADVVYGSRFQGSKPHRVLFFWHYIGNRMLTLFSNMVTNLNLTDMETGYKAFRRAILDDLVLREDRFGFEPEFTAKIAKMDIRIYEVGISYFGRKYSEGKKIGPRDAARAIYCILKYK